MDSVSLAAGRVGTESPHLEYNSQSEGVQFAPRFSAFFSTPLQAEGVGVGLSPQRRGKDAVAACIYSTPSDLHLPYESPINLATALRRLKHIPPRSPRGRIMRAMF